MFTVFLCRERMKKNVSGVETMKAQRQKAARMLKGMTQYDLAQLVGCSEALVSNVETGRTNPEPTLKARIANARSIQTWEVGA